MISNVEDQVMQVLMCSWISVASVLHFRVGGPSAGYLYALPILCI